MSSSLSPVNTSPVQTVAAARRRRRRAASLSGTSLLSPVRLRLGRHEFRRRLVHMLPGFLPFVLMPIPHKDPIGPLLKAIIVVLGLGLSTWTWLTHRTYIRRGETSIHWAVLGYAGSVLALLLAIPESPELGLTVMGIIAFGDGSATLVGLLARGRKLPWNPAKSWSGAAGFVLCATPLAALIYWGEARPGVSPATALACTAPAVLVAALAESLPSRINDNIRVGLAAAMTIVPLHAMFVG